MTTDDAILVMFKSLEGKKEGSFVLLILSTEDKPTKITLINNLSLINSKNSERFEIKIENLSKLCF